MRTVATLGGFGDADVIVLTDGQVWGLDGTVNFIKNPRLETEGRVRFFSLGIGNAVSHELVEGIAKAGGGYAEVIQTASQGGWEDRVVAVLRAAMGPHVGSLDFGLEWDDQDLDVISQFFASHFTTELFPPSLSCH